MRAAAMERSLDVLMQQLLQHTMRLEQKVLQDTSDSDEWLAILDEREKLIEQVQELEMDDTTLTEPDLDILRRVHEINQRLVSKMDDRKRVVQNQLNNIQRSKQAIGTYNENGLNAYGAFLDHKK